MHKQRRKQTMSDQNGGLLFFAGFVTGGVIGASLALLLAPQSGQETRDQIRDKGIELKHDAGEGLTEAGHRVQARVSNLQEAFEKGKHNAAEAIGHSVDNITQAVTTSRDKVVEAVG
jgi:gas vesicle protein